MSLRRLVLPTPTPFIAATTLWRIALGVAALTTFVVVRACGFGDHTLARYFGYFLLYVVVPGVVTLYAVFRRPLSLVEVLAVGVPVGFAVEIFAYLGCSALGVRAAYPWIPALWCAAALWVRYARGEWPVQPLRLSANHAGIVLSLVCAVFATVLMAASQMFSESPLAEGLPTRAIFHDWVYLVSRAAVIKHQWPLDDPSLSGTPLQYHYFMMVHAAAASASTGIEITVVMLRLLYLPLGAVLVMQAFVLGRTVARAPWAGVIAAVLTVAAAEMSFAGSYGEPMFLGLFARWLFVSPTFFFGMIFCGALLIVVCRCARLAQCHARHYTLLLLLGTAGTGAKGTVLPVFVGALGLWGMWLSWRQRKLVVRPFLFAVCLTTAFFIVYIPTMSAWRSGDAALQPFHAFQLASFWKEHQPQWQRWLATRLPAGVASPLASLMCAGVVFAGTCGIRALAIPYLLWIDREKRDAVVVCWVGAFFCASVGLGVLMELNSYGELYVLLMMRLPAAVLTAAFITAVARRFALWQREALTIGPVSIRRFPRRRSMLAASGVAAVAVLLATQTSIWWTRNSRGLRDFLRTPVDVQPDGYMKDLQEALLWVRTNTEPSAILVANSCTPENMKKDHWGALDHTLTGVHFYYSALSERRLWFEGPNYIMDTTRARVRASLASDFFYRGAPLNADDVGEDAAYVLLDRSLADGAKVGLPADSRVFANSRMEIYRLPRTAARSLPSSEKVAGSVVLPPQN